MVVSATRGARDRAGRSKEVRVSFQNGKFVETEMLSPGCGKSVLKSQKPTVLTESPTPMSSLKSPSSPLSRRGTNSRGSRKLVGCVQGLWCRLSV